MNGEQSGRGGRRRGRSAGRRGPGSRPGRRPGRVTPARSPANGPPTTVVAVSPSTVATDRSRRPWWIGGALAGVVVVIAVVLALLPSSGPPSSAPPSTAPAGHHPAAAARRRPPRAGTRPPSSAPRASSPRPSSPRTRRPGTTAWRITTEPTTGAITGFATTTYVAPGGTANLYVSTTEPTFRVQAYRMGWYGGDGGRLVWTSAPVTGGRPARLPPRPLHQHGALHQLDQIGVGPHHLGLRPRRLPVQAGGQQRRGQLRPDDGVGSDEHRHLPGHEPLLRRGAVEHLRRVLDVPGRGPVHHRPRTPIPSATGPGSPPSTVPTTRATGPRTSSATSSPWSSTPSGRGSTSPTSPT